MEWNYEGFINKYGFPVFDTPEEPVEGIDGGNVYTGVIEHWENEADGLKNNSDALNEFYRQFKNRAAVALETKPKIQYLICKNI